MRAAMARGGRASGDLIPWTLSQQFQDDGFAALSGARVVRIATHPDATKLGYGTRAMELLAQFYEGKLVSFGEGEEAGGDGIESRGGSSKRASTASAAATPSSSSSSSVLVSERVKPRKELPPLLVNVTDVSSPERLHWLGTSYGLTLPLFNFWRRGAYLPTYLRQTANDLTAEHTMIMIRPLDCADLVAAATPDAPAPRAGWHAAFVADFARRYMQVRRRRRRRLRPAALK